MLAMGTALVHVAVLCLVRERIGNVCDDKCTYTVKAFRPSRATIAHLYALDHSNGLSSSPLGSNFRVESTLCSAWCATAETASPCCSVADARSRGSVSVMTRCRR